MSVTCTISSFVLFTVLLQLANAASSFAGCQSPLVDTTSGVIQGHCAPNVSGVAEWLGIPYGQPPVGPLRFSPPLRIHNPHARLIASSFGSNCAVLSGSRVNNSILQKYTLAHVPSSEDCLFINVWNNLKISEPYTKDKVHAPLKPVLVFIHGGAFRSGGTNTSLYSGQYFASEQDVVFVNFNYRLGVFGFGGAPGLRQNPGLLDQRLAMEWIHDNIKAFGGDPARVTLFGQSAGGQSTDFYTYAYADEPLIAGTILESGNAVNFNNSQEMDVASATWSSVVQNAGCESADHNNRTALSCMRHLNTSEVLKAAGTFSFFPVIDNKTIFQNYSDRLDNLQYAALPVMMGYNNYEAGFFAALGEVQSGDIDSFDQTTFTCPISMYAKGRARQVPTWRYYYSGMFPNILIPTVNLSQSYHSAEIPVLFNTSEAASGMAPSAAELQLGTTMRGAWAAFASDPWSGLTTYGWPRYNASEPTLVLLGGKNVAKAGFQL